MCATSMARVVVACLPQPIVVRGLVLHVTMRGADKATGGEQLTCIEDSRLQCDTNTLERGRPLCRLASEFGVIN